MTMAARIGLGPTLTSIWLVALSMGGAACDDGTNSRGDTGAGVGDEDVADAESPSDTLGLPHTDGSGWPTGFRCVLTPSIVAPTVRVGSAIQIGVYQHSTDTGDPMRDEQLAFRIVTEASVAGRLSSEYVWPDQHGLAAVRLSVGPNAGTILVRVSSPCADSVDIEVTVAAPPTDALRTVVPGTDRPPTREGRSA